MAEFCSSCGVQVGFFSRKRVRLAGGAIKVFCKPCAARRTAEAVGETPDAPSTAASPTSGAASEAGGVPPAGRVAAPATFPPGGESAGRIAEHLVATFRAESGIDLSRDAMALERIRRAAEMAAAELASEAEVQVNLPFITADATGPKHLLVRIAAKR